MGSVHITHQQHYLLAASNTSICTIIDLKQRKTQNLKRPTMYFGSTIYLGSLFIWGRYLFEVNDVFWIILPVTVARDNIQHKGIYHQRYLGNKYCFRIPLSDIVHSIYGGCVVVIKVREWSEL